MPLSPSRALLRERSTEPGNCPPRHSICSRLLTPVAPLHAPRVLLTTDVRENVKSRLHISHYSTPNVNQTRNGERNCTTGMRDR